MRMTNDFDAAAPKGSLVARTVHGSEPGAEVLHLPLSLIPGNAVTLLNFSCQVFAIAFGHLQVIVGQFSPLRLCFPGPLFPVSFYLVFVYC